jgi:hypothetical protein
MEGECAVFAQGVFLSFLAHGRALASLAGLREGATPDRAWGRDRIVRVVIHPSSIVAKPAETSCL